MVEAPSPPYIPANMHGGHQETINRIVIHATVSPGAYHGAARDLANYWSGSTTAASCHYIVDPGEVIQAVYDNTVAYHSPPNHGSIGIEMCSEVDITDAVWYDDAHRAVVERTADLTRQLCQAYGVPMVWLSPADIRAGKRGVTDHENVAIAFGQSTHYDPDWSIAQSDEFMALVTNHEDAWGPEPSPRPTPSTKGDIMLTNTVLPNGEGRHDITIGGKNGASSGIVKDLYYTLISGYDGLSDIEVHFVMLDSLDVPRYGTAETGNSQRISDLPKDTSAYWKVPSGCVGVSFSYTCNSDGSHPVVYAEVRGY